MDTVGIRSGVFISRECIHRFDRVFIYTQSNRILNVIWDILKGLPIKLRRNEDREEEIQEYTIKIMIMHSHSLNFAFAAAPNHFILCVQVHTHPSHTGWPINCIDTFYSLFCNDKLYLIKNTEIILLRFTFIAFICNGYKSKQSKEKQNIIYFKETKAHSVLINLFI